MKMRVRFVAGLAFLVVMTTGASAQSLPDSVVRDLANLTLRGEAVMRFFGIKVYDVRLWTLMKPHSPDEPFALELVYDMSLKGRDIAERSIKEMHDQGHSDDAKLKRWGEEMARIFPDIKKGDTLVGVSIPGKEVRFYSREKFIAAVGDPEFARAFFDIWLSSRTNEPRLREQLLGSK